ncbi:MAG: kelch repeat-containing protein [Planctomycetota bacterium]
MHARSILLVLSVSMTVWGADALQPGWNLLPDSAKPGMRCQSTLTVDPQASRVYLLGGDVRTALAGQERRSGVSADLWCWSIAGGGWKQVGTGAHPSPRMNHAACWDTQRRGLWVFGGSYDAGMLGDLWFYDTATDAWSDRQATEVRPDAREGHILVRDDRLDRLILVGGLTSLTDKRAVNDVWAWSCASGGWKRLDATNQGPGPRYQAGAWHDSANRRLLSGGGFTSGGEATMNAMWALDLKQITWSAYAAPFHESPALTLTPISGNRLLALAGNSERIQEAQGAWKQRALITLPPRQFHAACSDANNRVWVYGGTTKGLTDPCVPAGLWVRENP